MNDQPKGLPFGVTSKLRTLRKGWKTCCPHYQKSRTEPGKLSNICRDERLSSRITPVLGLEGTTIGVPQTEICSSMLDRQHRWSATRNEGVGFVEETINSYSVPNISSRPKPYKKVRPQGSRSRAFLKYKRECPCHPGPWTSEHVPSAIHVSTRPRIHKNSRKTKYTKVASNINHIKPPDKGGSRRETLHHIGKRKLIRNNKTLCYYIQSHLIGVFMKAKTIPPLLSLYCREKEGWLMITKIIPFSLISSVLWLLSVVPNTASERIFRRLRSEITSDAAG